MQDKRKLGNFLLLLTAFIWGMAFASQRLAMGYVGPYTFMACRFLLASISLGVLLYFMKGKTENLKVVDKSVIKSGVMIGLVLYCGALLQQVGMVYTTAGKAGFITTLYIILVPILRTIFGNKIGKNVWIGVVTAFFGLSFIMLKENMSIEKGDAIVFAGSFFWAAHILFADNFTRKHDPVMLSFIQFLTAFVLSTCMMFILEKPSLDGIRSAFPAIFYAGVISAGVGFTLQIVAQKYTSPTVASLILCSESGFSVLGGYIVLHEVLTKKELIGCALMFAAIIIAQLPDKKLKINNADC